MAAAGTASGSARGWFTHDSTNLPLLGTSSSSIVFQSASAWQGWFIADSMLISGLSTRLGDLAGTRSRSDRPPGSRLRRRRGCPAASEYEASTGMPSRMCSALVAIHHGAEAGLELPGALAGRDHERVAAQPRHAGLERGQRAQAGVHEQQAQHLAGQCLRVGATARVAWRARPGRARQRVSRSARSTKRFMSYREVDQPSRLSAAASRSTSASLRVKGGSRRRMFGSPAGARQDVVFVEQRLLHVLGRALGQMQAGEEARALVADDGSDHAGACGCTRHTRRTLASRSSFSMASMVASMAAQAMGPAPKVVPRASIFTALAAFSIISSAEHGEAVAQRLGAGDHVGQHAVEVGGERLAAAAEAALHFVEDQHRAGFVAALAQGLEVLRAHVERAAHALHGLDDDGGGLLGDVRQRCRASRRGRNFTSNGVRGKPYHFLAAPQVSAPRGGGAAVEALLHRDDFGAAGVAA